MAIYFKPEPIKPFGDSSALVVALVVVVAVVVAVGLSSLNC